MKNNKHSKGKTDHVAYLRLRWEADLKQAIDSIVALNPRVDVSKLETSARAHGLTRLWEYRSNLKAVQDFETSLQA